LFPDKETPLLASREVIIPFTVFGNKGDCVAVYARFPKFSSSELDISRIKQAKIANADTILKEIKKEMDELKAKYKSALAKAKASAEASGTDEYYWEDVAAYWLDSDQERLDYLEREYYWEKDSSTEAKKLTIKDYMWEWKINYDSAKTKEQIKKLNWEGE